MPKRAKSPIQGELLQGTLDLLILKTLALGAAHGHTIAYAIEQPDDVDINEIVLRPTAQDF